MRGHLAKTYKLFILTFITFVLFTNQTICQDGVVLSGKALSGSGTELKGRHIIDPRTGQPASGHLASWASCPSATLASAGVPA